MYRIFFSLLVLITIIGSCVSSKNTEKIIIASQQGDCVGVVPMKCLLIKQGDQQDWEYFYNNIEGFNYEPGYEYVIEIRKETIENPAADQSSIRYVFLNEISRTKKESENLPHQKL